VFLCSSVVNIRFHHRGRGGHGGSGLQTMFDEPWVRRAYPSLHRSFAVRSGEVGRPAPSLLRKPPRRQPHLLGGRRLLRLTGGILHVTDAPRPEPSLAVVGHAVGRRRPANVDRDLDPVGLAGDLGELSEQLAPARLGNRLRCRLPRSCTPRFMASVNCSRRSRRAAPWRCSASRKAAWRWSALRRWPAVATNHFRQTPPGPRE